MEDPRPLELPIFELPLAIIPGERVPLHIFEERYKRMIGHAIEAATPFGILLRDSEGSRRTGCSARVERVLERHPDDRLDIVAIGVERFRVLEDRGSDEDPRALVEPLDAEGAGAEGADPADAHSAFEALLDAVGADRPEGGLPETAYGIAAMVELPIAFKQELLETGEESRRMVMVRTELRRLAAAARRSRKLAEVARGNGHAPISGLGR